MTPAKAESGNLVIQVDPLQVARGHRVGALPLDPPKGAKKRKGVQFRTAADVFAFVKKNMPLKKPGSLTDNEYAAILAFDLKGNGVDLHEKLDATNAAAIVLHP